MSRAVLAWKLLYDRDEVIKVWPDACLDLQQLVRTREMDQPRSGREQQKIPTGDQWLLTLILLGWWRQTGGKCSVPIPRLTTRS